MLFENIKLAFKSMWTNKMRTILSLLGIVIGVTSVVTILNLGNSATGSVTSTFVSGGLDTISVTVYNGRYADIFTEQLSSDIMKNIPEIEKILCTNSSSTRVRYKQTVESGTIYGVSSEYASVLGLEMEYGSFFEPEDNIGKRQVVVLGHDIAEDLFPDGNAVGQYVSIFRRQSKRYLVIGVLEEKESTLIASFNNTVFVPYNTYTQRYTKTSHVGSYIIRISEGFDTVAVSDRVSDYLDSLSSSDSYSVFSAASLSEMASEITDTLSMFLAAIAGISLLVGGIGIMNIMLVSVAERTKEIGIRKALGATPRVIKGQFITEAIVLTLSGGLIGLALGTGLSIIIVNIAGWTLIKSSASYIISVGFSMLIGVFFGWYPAKKASKLDPIECLNYE